ncbi:MAG: clan AA aspartic protease [Dehalococcoidia bacterium]
MIRGSVSADGEAIIPLVVLDTHGREHALQAIIDTGFSGFLTLPTAMIDALELPWLGRADAVLGDGALHEFDVFAATVFWDGQVRTVETDAADVNPLVGMGLLRGYAIEIHVTEDGQVRIEALP